MADDWEETTSETTVPAFSGSFPSLLGKVNKIHWEDEDVENDKNRVKESWEAEDEIPTKPKREDMGTEENKLGAKPKVEHASQKNRTPKAPVENVRNPSVPAQPLSPEEELVQKLRLQKLVEESDFQSTKELFQGQTPPSTSSVSLDTANPHTRVEFDQFQQTLLQKCIQFSSRPEFLPFLESFVREVCSTLRVDDLSRILKVITVINNEKLKGEREVGKSKKTKSGSKKAALRTDNSGDWMTDYSKEVAEDHDDDDDFM